MFPQFLCKYENATATQPSIITILQVEDIDEAYLKVFHTYNQRTTDTAFQQSQDIRAAQLATLQNLLGS